MCQKLGLILIRDLTLKGSDSRVSGSTLIDTRVIPQFLLQFSFNQYLSTPSFLHHFLCCFFECLHLLLLLQRSSISSPSTPPLAYSAHPRCLSSTSPLVSTLHLLCIADSTPEQSWLWKKKKAHVQLLCARFPLIKSTRSPPIPR